MAVLIGIHALILVHLTHWFVTGRTVGRFVLSDAMETLEIGRINPGFVLFLLAAIITLIGGRWLCGWACHMGALQDACGWLLRRCGVRPKPFRVRLLGYVPLALAFYMFVWPTLRREALTPALERFWPEAASWIGTTPTFPGWTTALVSDDLWRGLPSLLVAIPFLLVCGGATVFFLGSRGFCRYGCPYGGVFSALEGLAPARVRVDIESCDGCGRCTAACSSGVRVHEEVRAYDRVVSSQCAKTLDCIAACPRDALSLGHTRPGLFKGRARDTPPKRRFDATLFEEIFVIVVFAVVFFTVRGLYGLIPMLMAVGIAVCAAGVAWIALRAVRGREVALAGWPLRRNGKLTPSGKVFLLCAMLGGALVVHSAAVRVLHLRGEWSGRRVQTTRAAVFGGSTLSVVPEDAADAKEALRWYERGSSWRHGGVGLTDTPAIDVRMAWLRLVVGDIEGAERALRRLATGPSRIDALSADLARVLLMRNDVDGAIRFLRKAVARDGDFLACRDLLAALLARSGRAEESRQLYEDRLSEHPDDASCRVSFGVFLLSQADTAGAREHLRRAIRDDPRLARAHHALARSLLAEGDLDEAIRVLEEAADTLPNTADAFRREAERLKAFR